jgi:hypothetical protein
MLLKNYSQAKKAVMLALLYVAQPLPKPKSPSH